MLAALMLLLRGKMCGHRLGLASRVRSGVVLARVA
jgi:hypothetical protein